MQQARNELRMELEMYASDSFVALLTSAILKTIETKVISAAAACDVLCWVFIFAEYYDI
jgi:hypothetical protein